jgi:hypothetical protein
MVFMTFLAPIGLLALLALPIIFILHMLRERRRRVVVPSLLLWQRVPKRQVSERRFRIPRSLLLLLHLLIAALIGFALARPQFAGALPGSAGHTAIIIDTSTSMAAATGGATRAAEARRRVAERVGAMGAGDRVTLISAGPTARIIGAGGPGDIVGLLAAVDQAAPGGSGFDLPGALALAEATLDPEYSRRIVVLSDGGAGAAPATVGVPIEWVTIGDQRANRALVNFAARQWGNQIQVYARVANYDALPAATTLQLIGDDELVRSENVGIAANGETELVWTLPAEYATLRAVIDGRDALPDDDQAFLNVVRARTIDALLVSDRPAVLERALEAVPGVQVTIIDPATYAAGGRAAELTIFDSYLPEQWPAGATLAVNPPAGSALLDIAPQRDETTEELVQRGIAGGLILSGVSFGSAARITPPEWAEVQLAAGDLPLILRGRTGEREIAIWAFDPSAGSLPTRLAFPLLMGRTVRDLGPSSLPASIPAGTSLIVRPDPRADSVRITGPGDLDVTLAATPQVTFDTLVRPGFYLIEEQLGGEAIPVGWVGVNAGSPLEADLTPQPPPAIQAPAQDTGSALQFYATDIWPWLALAALLLLALEWGYLLR